MFASIVIQYPFVILIAFVVASVFGSLRCQSLLAEDLDAFINDHCVDCHNADETSGGLDLNAIPRSFATAESRNVWIKIHDRVNRGEMPPDTGVAAENRKPFVDALRRSLEKEISKQQSQGRTVLRRLNRREFENSLRDLLGVESKIQHLLPEDGRAHGFDTVAEGLRISAVQMEKYLEVIDLALDDSVRLTEKPKVFNKRLRYHDEKKVRENLDTPEEQVDPNSGDRHRRLFLEREDAIVFISSGYSPDVLEQFSPSATGTYRIRVSAYAVNRGESPIALKVFSSDWKSEELLGYFDLQEEKPRTIELTVRFTVKEHLRFAGVGIGVDADGKNVWTIDTVEDWVVPGMAIQWVEVEGPIFDQWPPASLANVFGDDAIRMLEKKGKWTDQGHIAYEIAPENAKVSAKRAIAQFAERAFRRPLRPGEADHFVKLAHAELDHKRSYEQAIRVAVRGILLSPRFLILDESPGRLDAYALASRLSYFFWSSPPDHELLALAADNSLLQHDVLHEQVERLLSSHRSQHFVSGFVGQWLDVDNIDATIPDKTLYPEYDELLRRSMVTESESFFDEVLAENLAVTEFIDSDFVMLDQRMAEHYELLEPFRESRVNRKKSVFDEQFRRVALPADSVRGGVLTQAAVLKVTANGTVTSPVVRGSWFLRQILGTPPSPPPPVAAIEPDTRGATTIRQLLAKHRDSETCNRCHREIDPPGFALESFDVIGGYRDRYRTIGEGDRPKKRLRGRGIWQYKLGLPVDCSGETSAGATFHDIREFKQLVLRDKEHLVRCLAGKLVSYSSGAGISFADREAVETIVSNTLAKGSGLRTLIHEVVARDLFLSK